MKKKISLYECQSQYVWDQKIHIITDQTLDKECPENQEPSGGKNMNQFPSKTQSKTPMKLKETSNIRPGYN